MANVVISDELRDQLRAAAGPVELVDSAGQVVGWFDSPDSYSPTAEEEAAVMARLAQGPGVLYTTAEVLAYARARAGQ